MDLNQEQCAKLLDDMLKERPWNEKPWARCALSIAARAIRRGRLLTDQEKMLNLAAAMEEEGDTEVADKIRQMVAVG